MACNATLNAAIVPLHPAGRQILGTQMVLLNQPVLALQLNWV